MLVVVAMLGLVVTVGYGCSCVSGGLIFSFFLAVGSGCHVEIVAGGVIVVVVAGWKVFVVDIFYFILMSSLYYFNQITKNIDVYRKLKK